MAGARTSRSGGAARPGDAAARDRRIIDVVRALRDGEVTTYGDVAEVAGHPGRSRLVGWLLARLGESDETARVDGADPVDDATVDDMPVDDMPVDDMPVDDADGEVPWWRVVTATGRLVPGGEHEQAARLAAEGVEVRGGRVRRAPIGRFSSPGRS